MRMILVGLLLLAGRTASAQCTAADSALGGPPAGAPVAKVQWDKITDSLRYEAPTATNMVNRFRFVGLGMGKQVTTAALEVRYMRGWLHPANGPTVNVAGSPLALLLDDSVRVTLTDATLRVDGPEEHLRWPVPLETLVRIAGARKVETRFVDVRSKFEGKMLLGAADIFGAIACQTALR